MSAAPGADSCRDQVLLSQFPVHRACRDGDLLGLVSLVERLSDQAHLTAEDSGYGWTPLHWAAHCGQLECVVHLVQLGCEVNTASSRLNQTPAHAAAFGGHPHCVVWLSQAGADVNRLRNSSGQTAADLAHAHGFLDCFCFMSSAQTDLQQFRGLQNGAGGAPCGRGLLYRKRQRPVREVALMKKARRAEAAPEQQVVQRSPAQEEEDMNLDLSPADESTTALPSSPHHPPASDHTDPCVSPPSADMCGSLHLSGSPGGSWRLMGEDCRDFLLYGHCHGFGDTAEDLSDSSAGVQLHHSSQHTC
ncbi:ankyrin repeat domain-containing protein 10 [Nematolebias whitei]|uniref:ankyrin repeat domain-containing protein 10 n=1 Tax=Nematolebias whitei TaxID=451745 RepID=UPI001897785D|nr:ankyrin repeat domain-containing protein 10 [Nematolebias whitei]